MNDPLLLQLLLLVPIVGAIVVASLGPRRISAIRWVSLAATLANLLISLVVAYDFAIVPDSAGRASLYTFEPSFATRFSVLPFGTGAVEFYIGVDGSISGDCSDDDAHGSGRAGIVALQEHARANQ